MRKWWMILACAGLALLAVLLARPDLVHRCAALAARVARRRPPPSPGRPRDLRRSLLYQTASWVLSGLHVWVTALLLGALYWSSADLFRWVTPLPRLSLLLPSALSGNA